MLSVVSVIADADAKDVEMSFTLDILPKNKRFPSNNNLQAKMNLQKKIKWQIRKSKANSRAINIKQIKYQTQTLFPDRYYKLKYNFKNHSQLICEKLKLNFKNNLQLDLKFQIPN